LKLLFDQNISPKIVKHINENFPGSKQVRQVNLEDASDDDIFTFARTNDFTIVTFDSDFVDLNTVNGVPPKVIWLRTGNMTTKLIEGLIDKSVLIIRDFLQNDTDEILEIDNAQ